MNNIFLSDYYTRLRAWHKLKENLKELPIEQVAVEVDAFWQKCPIKTYYLHPDDIDIWPSPWELLKDNNYCYYARALGMIYTLLFLGIQDIDFVEALDDNNTDVVLVLVDNAKYTLNWWPNSVLNTDLSAFKIKKKINITALVKKMGIQ
jgi:hypothetical protein